MAKVFIEETTLTSIGNAIRGKEGTTELVPVTDMATRISNLPSGGGGGNEPTDEELKITGDCTYRFSYDGWNWVIDRYGNRLTTQGITSCKSMFDSSRDLKHIPFQINIENAQYLDAMFEYCQALETAPKIRGTISWGTSTTMQNLAYYCHLIRDWEELFLPEMLDGFSTLKITSSSSPYVTNFNSNYSLRKIPEWWYKFKLNPESTTFPSSSKSLYYSMVASCFALDEIINIPVWKCTSALTSNSFSTSFGNCFRLKEVTFETNPDGTPIEVQWKAQTIDLSNLIGYTSQASKITSYNSGITSDKIVNDEATYNSLKNDPDWYTVKEQYSRYNKASAINTINSLPDTSVYLATAGGTNTIKFKKTSGSLTDGGAINTLTAEEIAVATAKGWTVTLV